MNKHYLTYLMRGAFSANRSMGAARRMTVSRSENVWIGAAAGFAGDRSDSSAALIAALAEHAGPKFLIFETLAERTLALAQLDRLVDPSRGEVPALARLLRPALAACVRAGIRIVGNFGGANPRG